MSETPEQLARNMLERMGIEGAQDFSAGRLVELANMIAGRQLDPSQKLTADAASAGIEMYYALYYSSDVLKILPDSVVVAYARMQKVMQRYRD